MEYLLPITQILAEEAFKEEKDYLYVPNKILMSEGTWNDFFYSTSENEKAFLNTDWAEKEIISLYLDHKDTETSAWAGFVRNPRWINGKLLGDLEIYHDQTIKNLKAGAKFGISPKILGITINGAMTDYTYGNFAIVTNPAVKTNFINNAIKVQFELNQQLTAEEELARVTGMEAEREKRGMSPAEFYAVPRDPPSSSSLPIFDAPHVRNAMARFNQTQLSPEEKKTARNKIIAAAKKFEIDTAGFESHLSEEDIHTNEKEVNKMAESEEIENKTVEAAPVSEKAITPEISEELMFVIVSHPEYSNFVKTMKLKDSSMTMANITKAFKLKMDADAQLEQASDEELISKFTMLSELLKKRGKMPSNEEKVLSMSQEIQDKDKKIEELNKSVQELSQKVKEPESQTVATLVAKPASKAEGFIQFLQNNIGKKVEATI